MIYEVWILNVETVELLSYVIAFLGLASIWHGQLSFSPTMMYKPWAPTTPSFPGIEEGANCGQGEEQARSTKGKGER